MKISLLFLCSVLLRTRAEDRSEGEDCNIDTDDCNYTNGECCHITGKDLTTLKRTMCVNKKSLTVKETEEPEETYGVNCYFLF